MASRYSKDSTNFICCMQFEGYEFEFDVTVDFTHYRGTTGSTGDDPSDDEVTSVEIHNFDEQVAIAKEWEVEYDMAPISSIEALREAVEDEAKWQFAHD